MKDDWARLLGKKGVQQEALTNYYKNPAFRAFLRSTSLLRDKNERKGRGEIFYP